MRDDQIPKQLCKYPNSITGILHVQVSTGVHGYTRQLQTIYNAVINTIQGKCRIMLPNERILKIAKFGD